MCIFLEGRFILFFGFPNRLAASPDAPSVRLTAMAQGPATLTRRGGRARTAAPGSSVAFIFCFLYFLSQKHWAFLRSP